MFSKSKIQLLCRHVVFGAIIGISLSAIATKHVRLTVVLAGACIGTIAGIVAIVAAAAAKGQVPAPEIAEAKQTLGANNANTPVLPPVKDLWSAAEIWRRKQAIAFQEQVISQIKKSYGKPNYTVRVTVPDDVQRCSDRFLEIVGWLEENGWACRHGWQLTRDGSYYYLDLTKEPESKVTEPLPANPALR